LPDHIRRIPLNLFGKVIGNRWNFLLFSIPVALILSTMEHGALKTSTSFIPDSATFGGYFLFFCFGWLLYLRREFLFKWTRHPWIQVSAGLALSIPHFLAVRSSYLEGETPTALWVAAVTGALIIWLFTFGLIGLCMRYLDRPIPVVRYLVDASYWLYLVHLPMTIWFPGLLANLEWSPWIKSSLVLLLTTLISLGSYDLFVRNSFIGKLLNGRRYTRGLPPPDEAPREVPESAVPSFAPRT
jgi:glucan biosynthesis protein C